MACTFLPTVEHARAAASGFATKRRSLNIRLTVFSACFRSRCETVTKSCSKTENDKNIFHIMLLPVGTRKRDGNEC